MWSLDLALHSGPGLCTLCCSQIKGICLGWEKWAMPQIILVVLLQPSPALHPRAEAVSCSYQGCKLLFPVAPPRERQELVLLLVLGLGHCSLSTRCFTKPQFAYLSEGFWAFISFESGLTSLMGKMLSALLSHSLPGSSLLFLSHLFWWWAGLGLPGFNHAS